LHPNRKPGRDWPVNAVIQATHFKHFCPDLRDADCSGAGIRTRMIWHFRRDLPDMFSGRRYWLALKEGRQFGEVWPGALDRQFERELETH
jgi:hypothetical protein